MLAKRIIACLDVKAGRVVKGVKFEQLQDAGDPAEVAGVYDAERADELVFLDIEASLQQRPTMLEVVRRTAGRAFMPLTVGGGVNTIQAIQELLAAGCDKVSVNTAAIQRPGFVEAAATRFGSQCIVVAIDAKRRPSNGGGSERPAWEVYTHGGRMQTGRDAVAWARAVEREGAGEILLTSMDRDGTKDGYDLELTREVARAVNIPVIASGGAGQLEHLYEALTVGEADAVLCASIFHYREFTVPQAKEYLASRGVPIRK